MAAPVERSRYLFGMYRQTNSIAIMNSRAFVSAQNDDICFDAHTLTHKRQIIIIDEVEKEEEEYDVRTERTKMYTILKFLRISAVSTE